MTALSLRYLVRVVLEGHSPGEDADTDETLGQVHDSEQDACWSLDLAKHQAHAWLMARAPPQPHGGDCDGEDVTEDAAGECAGKGEAMDARAAAGDRTCAWMPTIVPPPHRPRAVTVHGVWPGVGSDAIALLFDPRPLYVPPVCYTSTRVSDHAASGAVEAGAALPSHGTPPISPSSRRPSSPLPLASASPTSVLEPTSPAPVVAAAAAATAAAATAALCTSVGQTTLIFRTSDDRDIAMRRLQMRSTSGRHLHVSGLVSFIHPCRP